MLFLFPSTIRLVPLRSYDKRDLQIYSADFEFPEKINEAIKENNLTNRLLEDKVFILLGMYISIKGQNFLRTRNKE